MVLGIRTLGKGLLAGVGVATGATRVVAWVSVGTVSNLGRVVLAAKAAVTGERGAETRVEETQLVVSTSVTLRVATSHGSHVTGSQEGEGPQSASSHEVPVQEAFPEPATAEHTGTRVVLPEPNPEPVAATSTSSMGTADGCGCQGGIGIAGPRSSVSESGCLERQEQGKELLRTTSFCEVMAPLEGSEARCDLLGAAPGGLSSPEQGEELLSHSAVSALMGGLKCPEAAEHGRVAASTLEGKVQQVELAPILKEMGAAVGPAELEPEGAEALAFEEVTFNGSALELLQQWEERTGYKGLPEVAVLRSLQQVAELLQRKHQQGTCLLDITPASTLLTGFLLTAYPIWGVELQAGAVVQAGNGEGQPVGSLGALRHAVGTWAYMAQEMKFQDRPYRYTALGDHIFWDFPVGPACDIFSLAKTAGKLLPPTPSRYTRELLSRMTEEFPEERPTAAELLTLLAKHPLLA